MKSPSELRNELRAYLNTPSLRRWLKEEFLPRTKAFLQGIPVMAEMAYTTPATYTVRLVDPITGEEEESQWTEAAIRAEFGDSVFEEAYSQLPGGDAYVDLADHDKPLSQMLAEVEQELSWGTWDQWLDDEDDEPN